MRAVAWRRVDDVKGSVLEDLRFGHLWASARLKSLSRGGLGTNASRTFAVQHPA